MELYQLTQIINDPTRITESTESLLDVCITSSPEKIILGISDHSLIYAVGKLNYVPKIGAQNLIEYRNFKHFNAESFLNDLYILPGTEIDNKENVDRMWEYNLGFLLASCPRANSALCINNSSVKFSRSFEV